MKVSVIVNPISGNGRSAAAIDSIGAVLDKAAVQWTGVVTEYAGHAFELARQAVTDGCDVVVAVGGDGTVNEVASALVGTDTALAVIPRGSGNGLAFHLGIPHKLEGAIRVLTDAIAKPQIIKTIDTAVLKADGTERPFFCSAGIGYDAKVAFDYASSGHRGLATYTSKAVEDWMKYEPDEYKISSDNADFTVKALLITCGNANQWGNNFHIAPDASLLDGVLDVTIVHPLNPFQAIPMAVQLLGYGINRNHCVESLKTSRVRIERLGGDTRADAHFDGEPFKVGKVNELWINPMSLKVVAPAGHSL